MICWRSDSPISPDSLRSPQMFQRLGSPINIISSLHLQLTSRCFDFLGLLIAARSLRPQRAFLDLLVHDLHASVVEQPDAVDLATVAVRADVGGVGEDVASQVYAVIAATRRRFAGVGDFELEMLALGVCGLNAATHLEGYIVRTRDELRRFWTVSVSLRSGWRQVNVSCKSEDE